MLKEVIPELSCPIVLFTYYNPILKRGVRNFMATIRQVGVNGKFAYIASHADYCCFIHCYYKMFLILASSAYRKHDLHLIQTFCWFCQSDSDLLIYTICCRTCSTWSSFGGGTVAEEWGHYAQHRAGSSSLSSFHVLLTQNLLYFA